MRYFFLAYFIGILLVVGMFGFRGDHSVLPPFEIFNDMDRQPKLLAQSPSYFFADGRSGRDPIPGTIPVGFGMPETALSRGGTTALDGFSAADDYLHTGKMGEYYGHGIPEEITVDQALLELGQAKYQIFCLPCHGASGNGGGVISKYGLVPGNLIIPPVTDPAQRPDGNIYDVLTNGKGNMGPYGAYLTLRERWAVVAYVRALQFRTTMPAADVEEEEEFKAWEASKQETQSGSVPPAGQEPEPQGDN